MIPFLSNKRRQGNREIVKRGPDLYRRDKEDGREEEGETERGARGGTYLSRFCVGGLQTFFCQRLAAQKKLWN